MSLVIIAHIKKKFVLSQTLRGRLGAKNVLKTNHLGKSLGRIANIELKKSPELSLTYTRIQVLFNSYNSRLLKNFSDRVVQSAIVVKSGGFQEMTEITVKSCAYLFGR